MAQLDRTALKEFFETGDKPTQEQFADLIDSFLTLAENSNIKNGTKIKSETNGNLQIEISDGWLYISTDGDDFITSYFTVLPHQVETLSGESQLTLKGVGSSVLKSATDYNLDLLSGNGNGISIKKDSVAGQVRVKLNSLGTYANNAAALADGREVKEIYKTVTGELRIVV